MKNIFFGCSMRGGDSLVKRSELAKFPEIIEKLDHKIMSKHQSPDNFFEDESKLSDSEIHYRDYKWIKNSDAGISEISIPSLGIGESLDLISGMISRAPFIMRILGLEWLWRLIRELKSIKRVYNATIKFSFMVLMAKMKGI